MIKSLNMPGNNREKFAMYVRNFVFGVEDSLVSTVGLLSGIASAGVERGTILLTGVILIFVEALSMAVGSYLSEYSAEEYMKHKEASFQHSFIGGVIMFFSYFFAGFIPLFPYVLAPRPMAFALSIIASLLALFALGVVSAKTVKRPFLRSAFRMLLLGGVAIAVGVIVGGFMQVSGLAG